MSMKLLGSRYKKLTKNTPGSDMALKNSLWKMGFDLAENDWLLLWSKLEEVKLKPKTLLKGPDEKCASMWYLVAGAVRSYEIINGSERNTHFYWDGAFFTDFPSVLRDVPTKTCLELEEYSVLLRIDYKQLIDLYAQSPLLQEVGKSIAEHHVLAELQFRKMILYMDGAQRYQYLMTYFPEMLQKFSLKDLATFIGIAPSSLSRLRSK